MDQNELYSTVLNTHVTAIKFIHNYLLFGEGNRILCFDWKQKQCIDSVKIFAGCSIHGIRIATEHEKYIRLVVFGAKSLRVIDFSLSGSSRFTMFTREQEMEDWIHDVQCIVTQGAESLNMQNIAVVTAHNCVLIWNWMNSEIKKQFHCSERCILYSACLLNWDSDCIIVAVGTVFKEVLIWSPNILDEPCDKKVPFHRLVGHQGVIFSVTYNSDLNLLCSTSDDRSLRLWKLSHLLKKDINNLNSVEYWKTATVHLQSVLFAHESRVWTSVILQECIISAGEDSTICFWTHNGKLVSQTRSHRGGSIWCIDVNQESLIAATGGSDSGVLLWNVKEMINRNTLSEIMISSDLNDDFPRTISILSDSGIPYILSTTEKGKLFLYDLEKKYGSSVHDDPLYASYCIASVSFCGSIILLGSICGTLTALKYKKNHVLLCKKWNIADGKIMNIHWLDEKSELVLICGVKGHMTLWLVKQDSKEFATLKSKLLLPVSKHHWWSTVACYISTTDIILVGDGSGSIHVYFKIAQMSQEMEVKPQFTYRSLHGMHGVTDVQRHHNNVYTAGRDGRVLCYSLSPTELKILHNIKVPHDLEWLGKLMFVNNDLVLVGFHTTCFMVWSTKQERTLLKVDCGGGHRSWDFSLKDDGAYIFACIKKKKTFYMKGNLSFLLKDSSIQNGISGMSLCCTCYLFEWEDENTGPVSIIACGGEDPALKFIGVPYLNKGSGSFMLLRSVTGHLSNIRAISKCATSLHNSFLMVTVGGRAQMMLWLVKLEKGLVCEELATDFLWNIDKSAKKHWKEKSEPVIDPQTRYMDVTVFSSKHNPNEFCISVACSDGFIRFHKFDITKRKFVQKFSILYGEHCILKMSLLPGICGDSILLAAAATDGNIKIYDCSFFNQSNLHDLSRTTSKETLSYDDSLPLFQNIIHQSGVNALDINQISEKDWLVCSGGDDNSISAFVLRIQNECDLKQKLEVISLGVYLNAHASQVTGIKFLPGNKLLSVSIDQRVNLWQLELCEKTILFNNLQSEMCFIPDVAHLEVWKSADKNLTMWSIVVCGQGLEYFCFKELLHQTVS